MNDDVPAYGLWFLVVPNAAVFILFAFICLKPKTARKCRANGRMTALRPYQHMQSQ